MPRKKLFVIIAAVFALIGIILAVYLITKGNTDTSVEDSVTDINVEYLSDEYSLDNATYITAENGNISIDGSGASVKSQALTISNKGVYVLSGDFADGITIDARGAAVYVVLNNANITNSNGACIYAKAVDTLYLASMSNTTNTLADGEDYSENYGTEDVDAAVYSKGNLALIGDGKIEIVSNHYHGIHSKDYLQVLSGEYLVSAIRNGVMGKDYVAIKDGTLNITSGNDGIKSNQDTDTKLGYIVIDGGNITVNATGDAIHAETRISISGGALNLTTGGGAKITSTNQEWGRWGDTSNANSESNTSAKGIKAEKYILIDGGNITLNTSDDAIHSNTNVVINNGDITINSGDDGIHADSSLIVNNGNVDIAQSYEGIEAESVTVNDGNISVVASDDGFNAAGGNDSSSVNGRAGQNNFGGNSVGSLTFNGGIVYVNSTGDGLDSNNSITITGGYITVDGPTSNGNGALDHDGNMLISGGTLIAAGSSGMLELPSTSSTQNSICIVFSSTPSANTEFTLKDTDGNTIVSYTPSKQYASIIVSTPEIATNASYTAYTGDLEAGTITVTSPVSSYGNGGGNMNRGGMRR